MRNRWITLLPALVLVIGYLVTAPTEAAACMQQPTGTGDYDKRDFSGIWFRAMPRQVGGDCGFGPQGSNPPLTPAGEAAIKKNIPTNTRHPLQSKIAEKDPAQSNDPAFDCNPKGFPQIVVDTAHDHHEVVQLPTRIFQIWQEERRLREIWMDGRPLPSGDNMANLGTSWYGMSVGRWEGDTLVVDTVGLDPRAWLDIYGFPKSDEARVEERYKRIDANTMEVQLTLNDPKYYTKPWVSDVKRWTKEARDAKTVNNFGWYGLFSGVVDLICAPVNAGGGGIPSNRRGGD